MTYWEHLLAEAIISQMISNNNPDDLPLPPPKKKKKKEDTITNKKQTKASEEKHKKKTPLWRFKQDNNNKTGYFVFNVYSHLFRRSQNKTQNTTPIYIRTIMISNNCENHSTFYILDKNNTGHLPLIQLSVLLCYLSFPSKTWGLGSLYLQIMTS